MKKISYRNNTNLCFKIFIKWYAISVRGVIRIMFRYEILFIRIICIKIYFMYDVDKVHEVLYVQYCTVRNITYVNKFES